MTRTCTVIFLLLISWTLASECAGDEPATMPWVNAQDIGRGDLNPVQSDQRSGSVSCWVSPHADDAARINRLNTSALQRCLARSDTGGGLTL